MASRLAVRARVTAAAVVAVCALALAAFPAGAEPPSRETGERIYRAGALPGGRPLRGEREGGTSVEGEVAACVSCHRRSGLGSWEGRSVIPPITGAYLFRPAARTEADPETPHVQGYLPKRAAYTPATLARAIREGVDPDGRRLSFLMPRYRLDDASLAALTSYLQGLSGGAVPGVERDTLHFATVVTPDADPVARRGMLEVLQRFFADKNAGYRGDSPPMRSARGVMYRVNRRWQLHVWELTGPPEGWERQLAAKAAAEPPFAIVSGLGGRTWAPVHRFCERSGTPCLFPNVEVPVVAEDDFYPVYFSAGVLLEARLVARGLADLPPGARVVQVFRRGDAGEDAAAALRAALGPAVVDRPLEPGAPAAPALAEARAGDALVLWLRRADLAALPGAPGAARVLASGLLAGLDGAAVPAPWRAALRMTYPFDLPAQRKVRLDFALGWFRVRHVPVVAERVQADTYLACQILSESVGHMLDAFVRDYLVERVEALVGHRLVNGYYPRLGLAPGQRLASKGGYLVRLDDRGNPVADGPWRVP